MKPNRMFCAEYRIYMRLPKWMRRQWKNRHKTGASR